MTIWTVKVNIIGYDKELGVFLDMEIDSIMFMILK